MAHIEITSGPTYFIKPARARHTQVFHRLRSGMDDLLIGCHGLNQPHTGTPAERDTVSLVVLGPKAFGDLPDTKDT